MLSMFPMFSPSFDDDLLKYFDHICPVKVAINWDGLANRLPKLSCKSDLDCFYVHIPYELTAMVPILWFSCTTHGS